MFTENGWEQIPGSSAHTYTIPGTSVQLPLHPDAAPLMLAAAAEWHLRIEALHPGWCWGWSPTNDVPTSNHLSGTAMDLNAPLHNWGTRGTFHPDRIPVIHEICAKYGLFWGGDWTGKADEMHIQMADSVTAAQDRTRTLQLDPNGNHLDTPSTPSTIPPTSQETEVTPDECRQIIREEIATARIADSIAAATQSWNRFKVPVVDVASGSVTLEPLQTALGHIRSAVPADAARDAALATAVANLPADTVAELATALTPPAA